MLLLNFKLFQRIPKMTKKLSDYENEGYEGIDSSLEISLFEYGLIWKIENPDTQEYKFIFGVETNSGNYTKFDYGFMSLSDFNDKINESWFSLPEVLKFAGTDTLNFPQDVHTIIQYHGFLNIFGDCYSSFVIENDDE
jgi:hypothetical protein